MDGGAGGGSLGSGPAGGGIKGGKQGGGDEGSGGEGGKSGGEGGSGGSPAHEQAPPASIKADLVVALHACGGLSDVALTVAARSGASCLVCTCCFGQHRALSPAASWGCPPAATSGLDEAGKDVLCRMADSVEPAIANEARRIISSFRLGRLRASVRADRRLVDATIRTFPAAFSRQNVVLSAVCVPCGDE